MLTFFKNNKALRLALCLLLVSVICLGPALAFVEKTEEFYVADYAEVLSQTTKDYIISENQRLYEETGGQIVVVTVQYLDGYYSDEYALQLFNDWGVGSADKNNGMLLLLATMEGKAWLTQGSGIMYDFSDDYIGELLDDYFWKDFDRGDFDGAVNKLFPQLINWYDNYYGSSKGGYDYYDNSGGNYYNNYDNGYTYNQPGVYSIGWGLGGFSIVSIFIGFIVIFFLLAFVGSIFGRSRRRYFFFGPRIGPRWGRGYPPPPPGGFYNNFYGGGFNSSHNHRTGGGFGGGFGGSNHGGGGFGGGGAGRGGGGFSGGGGGRGSGGGGGRR